VAVVVHACSNSTWEAEVGGSQVGGQPRLCKEALTHIQKIENCNKASHIKNYFQRPIS
jgi:hypothetical protein